MARTSENNDETDPREVESAVAMWHGFTRLVKWSVIASAVVLLLLLLFFY